MFILFFFFRLGNKNYFIQCLYVRKYALGSIWKMEIKWAELTHQLMGLAQVKKVNMCNWWLASLHHRTPDPSRTACCVLWLLGEVFNSHPFYFRLTNPRPTPHPKKKKKKTDYEIFFSLCSRYFLCSLIYMNYILYLLYFKLFLDKNSSIQMYAFHTKNKFKHNVIKNYSKFK